MDGTASLLAAIPFAQSGIVFGRGRGWTPWQQVLTGGWDMCLDFTGNDRSALATALSRAQEAGRFRVGAAQAGAGAGLQRLEPVESARGAHGPALPGFGGCGGAGTSTDDLSPELGAAATPPRTSPPYALLHPGTARPEKYWLPERWGEVAAHLRSAHGLKTIFTCGPEESERAHVAAIPHGRTARRTPMSAIRRT